MFGFTQGSDIIEKGKVEISGEAADAFSKRVGRYRAGRLIGSFDFAPVDRLSIEFGARGNAFSIRNVPDLDNRHSGGFGGFSTEIKWQAVKRGPSSPFGLTFVIEPDVTIRDDEAGARGRGVGLETRLALDAEIVPETVFGAVNLLYEIEKFRPRGLRGFNSEGELLAGPPSGPCPTDADDAPETCVAFARRREAERSSLIGVSGALAFQAIPNVFVGAEARYMRSYDGLRLGRFEGQCCLHRPYHLRQAQRKRSNLGRVLNSNSWKVGRCSKSAPGPR